MGIVLECVRHCICSDPGKMCGSHRDLESVFQLEHKFQDSISGIKILFLVQPILFHPHDTWVRIQGSFFGQPLGHVKRPYVGQFW